MRKFLLVTCVCLTIAWSQVLAQGRTVSGKVTATEDGGPLPGVNVVVKGTAIGTVTDAGGLYTLSVPADATTLVFSFIGLTSQEVEIGGRTTIDIQMSQDIQQLGEVVVTAAGIEREKKSLGFRLENVAGSKVQQVSEADPLRALQGKVAGVNIIASSGVPGSSTRITMRGNRSLLGNNQPLIVVDGIPYDNSQTNTSNQLVGGGAYGSGLAAIDPNNIESMNILPPGGAGSALYGVRAANGVIVITTKTGTSRASRKGLEISVNSSFSMEEISGLPDYQNKYGTGTGFVYGQVNGSWGAPFQDAVPYPTITTIPRWTDIRAAFPDGPATVPYRAYPNNVKDFFNRGAMWDNSISLSGGNEKSNFTTTISRIDQTGIVPESKFERTNISVGANTILSNKVTIGGTMSFNNRVQHGPPGGASNALGNGSAFARTMYLGRNWDLQGEPFENPITRQSIFFVARTQATNPYWSAKYDGFETRENRMVGNLNFGYDFTENLSLSYRVGLTHFDQMNQEWFRPGGRAVGGVGSVTDDYVTFTELESFLMLSYTKELSEDITLKTFIAHNINQRTTDQQSYTGTGLVDFDIIDIDNTTNVLNNGGIYSRRRLVGLLGEVQLQYRDYFFLTVNGRNDWSSTLPVANRSFFYPAISTSFLFTDALNMSSSVLTSGKLRASWSKTGNDAAPYLLNTTYSLNPQFVTQSVQFPFRGTAGATLGGIPGTTDIVPDPNLTPEFTRAVELGALLQFFNNRASLDFSVYHSLTTNGIAFQSLPAVSGFTNYLTNFGDVSNRGLEVGLNVTPVKLSNSFSWDINANFTHNRNVVEKLAPGVDEIVIRNLFGGGITPVLRPGEEYGIMRGSVDARDDEGNLLIDPSNGQLIRAQDPAIVGNPNPDFIVGVTNTFSYKGITLSALFDWRQGGDIYSTTILSQLGRGVTRDTENREMNFIIPGVIGDVNTGEPILDESGNKIPNDIQVEVNDLYFGETFGVNSADEWNVFDGTVYRLREVGIGYTLPQSLLAKTPFGTASITLTGRNLWYWAPNTPKHSNFDPETSTFGTQNAQGFEFDNVPSVRRYGVNLKFTF
ncbi:MAG TPA: SusC/RagA family TonB-linked outer membrane protein [Chryseosolibacter sp.]|nr:SusC/RagA family TonB-linked outer membrane protein [Chryseosolibacter sp.]